VSFRRTRAPTDVIVHGAGKLKRVDAVSLTRRNGEAEEDAEFSEGAILGVPVSVDQRNRQPSDHRKLEEAERSKARKTVAQNQQVAVSFRRAPAPTEVVVHGGGDLGVVAQADGEGKVETVNFTAEARSGGGDAE
jgi:hypothetical protein